MLGVRFTVGNEYGNILEKITDNIIEKEDICKINYEDIHLTPPTNNNSLFPNKVISGDEFIRCISNKIYYICFAKISVFANKNDICEVMTFTNYFQSKCKFVLFFTDAIFVDVYSNSSNILHQLKVNAEKYGFDNIEYIYKISEKDLDLMKE